MPLFKKNIKYSTIRTSKKDMPEGLWIKCKACSEMIYKSALRENNWICPKCDHHYPMPSDQRIKMLTDENSFKEIDANMTSVD
ncbi:MAG: acetyl-CoA carboxylase carboxyl transferase subunit beta, partial [Verrucomicrobiota bacterium]|nr:acetyl-CoA carboxylase carboxyl transferase subunit beta [Verrucomicrobiota bacterium]